MHYKIQKKAHILTHGTQLTNISMYHALTCTVIQIQLKQSTNQSDILVDRNIIMFPPNLVTSTSRDQLAVPERLFKRRRENRTTVRFLASGGDRRDAKHRVDRRRELPVTVIPENRTTS